MIFKNQRLGTRLLIAFLIVGILPFSIIGYVSLMKSTKALQEQAFNQLEAVREIKKDQIQTYFKTVENQMATFSENKMTSDAIFKFAEYLEDFTFENNLDESNLPELKNKLRDYYENDFKTAYDKHSPEFTLDVDALLSSLSDEGTGIQYFYIAFNSNSVDKKFLMDEANDLSGYTRNAHKIYHPSFRNYMEKFGFQDIILIKADSGNVIYSVCKRPEYGTSLIKGPFKDSRLGNIKPSLQPPSREK